jgi:SAM-dependent methyltransferase
MTTGGIEPLGKFRIRSRNARFGVRYQPTSEQEVVDAVNFLKDDLQTLTFIDFGCGKGRTVLVASKLGFRKIIGVELASELVQIARANLAKTGVLKASVIHGDAADCPFPNSDCVLYLYKPFSHEVMSRVTANPRQSHAKSVFVLYSNPLCADLLDSNKFLHRLGCPPGGNIQIWTVAK